MTEKKTQQGKFKFQPKQFYIHNVLIDIGNVCKLFPDSYGGLTFSWWDVTTELCELVYQF